MQKIWANCLLKPEISDSNTVKTPKWKQGVGNEKKKTGDFTILESEKVARNGNNEKKKPSGMLYWFPDIAKGSEIKSLHNRKMGEWLWKALYNQTRSLERILALAGPRGSSWEWLTTWPPVDMKSSLDLKDAQRIEVATKEYIMSY